MRPAITELLARAAERGEGLDGVTSSLVRLIEHYGAASNYFHAGAGCCIRMRCGSNRGVTGGQESVAAGGNVYANAFG
jgi:hypothetical protein